MQVKLFFSVAIFVILSSLNVQAASRPKVKRQHRRPFEMIAPAETAAYHYQQGVESIERDEWQTALIHLNYIRTQFPNSPHMDEVLFLAGKAHYYLGQLAKANRAFSEYLQRESSPHHFEEVFAYKFRIAEYYREGGHKQIFGLVNMPRLLPARQEALDLYEEIYTSIPGSELAARSLYARGLLHEQIKDFPSGVERFQVCIERFPKHVLAPECYLSIARCYLGQARAERHNPDLLALAQINVRKFRHDFPTDERLIAAELLELEMREVFATGLMETGQFYEKTAKPSAAAVYYGNVIAEFPNTEAAKECRERLLVFGELGWLSE